MKKLTKQDILKGKEAHETLHVEQYGSDVVIRPLTDGELTEVLGLIGSIPVTPSGNPDTARVDLTRNFQALRLAVSVGMVEPKLTTDEVGEMKFGVPEFIGTRILELSGVTNEAAAKKKERR
ncbi:MAG: hypothetical protein LUO97_00305 [Methanomicrobiales archaeon]|nr:hypothetical protein [Methanomicrobiales archaeon]MDD1668217.1 hypothetical protein [Methanomicrobiales archaeon]